MRIKRYDKIKKQKKKKLKKHRRSGINIQEKKKYKKSN
jgi:hypothetical protein